MPEERWEVGFATIMTPPNFYLQFVNLYICVQCEVNSGSTLQRKIRSKDGSQASQASYENENT